MNPAGPSDDEVPSIRVAAATRERLLAMASARGETIQAVAGEIVERFMANDAGAPPSLADVASALRAHAPDLARRGVARLWIFGSVARSQARTDSDMDLLAEFRSDARVSVVGMASLRAGLSDLLGADVDLVERNALLPAVQEAAERDAVRVP